MIPSVDEVCAAFLFVARRHHVDATPSAASIGAALGMVRELAPEQRDMAAAMFYSFSRHPRSFPGMTRSMTILLAINTARAAGIRLGRDDADELTRMVFRIAEERMVYADVRAWFRERLSPEPRGTP